MSNETAGEFRPLITESSKMKPLKQIYAGFEIEKRFLLLTIEGDSSKKENAAKIYDEVLQQGILIEQGYIKDIPVAAQMLDKLGIELNDFKPNTIRIRKFADGFKKARVSKAKYVLTLKDRKETKKREVEFKLDQEKFEELWPLTEGARIQKKRLRKEIKGFSFEIDAFTDRFLLIAECEVDNEKQLDKVPKLGTDITGDKNWTNKTLSR